MMAIAQACADRVTVPTTAACCGMAGDAGMRMPDVVTAALRHERAEILAATDVEAWYSVNTTCEIALEEQTGRSVRTLLALVEEHTRPVA
jgi:D-lactate dehydrogenase